VLFAVLAHEAQVEPLGQVGVDWMAELPGALSASCTLELDLRP